MTYLYNLPVHLLLDLDISVIDRMEQVAETIEQYQTLKLAGRWDELTQHASRLGGLAEVVLHQLSARSVVGGLVRESLAAKDKMFRDILANIGDGNSAETVQAREALLKELVEELGDPIEARSKMDSLFNGEGALFEQAKRFARLFNKHEELLVDAVAELRALMVNAEFFGMFQESGRRTQAYNEKLKSKLDGFPGLHLLRDDTDAVAELIDSMQSKVEEGYSKIFKALQDEVSVEAFVVVAEAVYSETGPLSGLTGMLLGGYLALAQLAEDLEARQTHLKVALKATEWQSRISLLHIYTAYVRANTQSRDVNRWYSNEKKRVTTRQLASTVPQGTAVSVEKVIQDVSLSVGEMFQLEGVVVNLRIEDDPGPPKFSSFFELTNPISGNVVKVRAHMFSLLNNGVSDGAYCRLNGFLRRDEPWIDNDAVGIDIDRVNLTQLRKESWIDDIAHRMRPFYTLFLDEMNMFYTPRLIDGGN